ncbi:helix-turn-helix transcriptional regulator [Helicovermis profundi]
MEFNERQTEIISIVKKFEPITSVNIAGKLELSRSAIRSDLSILTMSGILEAKPKVGYRYIQKSERELVVNMIKNLKINELKSLPICVDEKVSVYDAIVTMFLEDVGSLYVLQENYLAGVVSRKDFLKAAIGDADMKNMPVGIIMTRMPNIVVIHPNESVYAAAKKIIDHQIDALPVVEDIVRDGVINYKVIGRISKTNITKVFTNLEIGGE